MKRREFLRGLAVAVGAGALSVPSVMGGPSVENATKDEICRDMIVRERWYRLPDGTYKTKPEYWPLASGSPLIRDFIQGSSSGIPLSIDRWYPLGDGTWVKETTGSFGKLRLIKYPMFDSEARSET